MFHYDLILWLGWPILLFVLALNLHAIGIGIWLRNQLVRDVASLFFVIFGAFVVLWAKTTLLPQFIPCQMTFVFLLVEDLLLFFAGLYSSLTHPMLRRY